MTPLRVGLIGARRARQGLGPFLARDLRAGSVWVNDWHMMRTDAPFGGYKQSGYGRELGRYSIDAYVETKAVSMSFERRPEKKGMQRIVHTRMAWR